MPDVKIKCGGCLVSRCRSEFHEREAGLAGSAFDADAEIEEPVEVANRPSEPVTPPACSGQGPMHEDSTELRRKQTFPSRSSPHPSTAVDEGES